MDRSKKSPRANSPVWDFTLTLLRNEPGGIRYWHQILLYYAKFIAFEPFRLLEKAIYGRKIAAYRLKKDPVFILGYYRSGTTHLQEILMQDRQFGYLNFYQCYFQKGFLVTERFFKKTFGWIMTTAKYRHPAHNVPFLFDMPGEEDVSMVASGFGLACCWGQVYPKYFRDYFDRTVFFEGTSDEDRELFEFEMMELFKRVAIANQDKQLILKSPPQTARPAMLARLFPNAKFIYIRRNPHLVFKSNQKLWRTFDDQCLQSYTKEQADENILWSFDKCLAAYERDKHLIPQGQLVEISYEELMADPMGIMKRIYEKLSLSGFTEASPRIQAFLDEKHGSNVDRYQYREEEFTLVETHWKRWLELGGYGRPVPKP